MAHTEETNTSGSFWNYKDKVPYESGPLRGECLAPIKVLNLHGLPWDNAPETLEADPVSGVRCVKRSRTRCVLQMYVPMPNGNSVRLFAKRFKPRRNLRYRLFGWLGKSKCHKEFEIGWQATRRGVPVALPVLWAEERDGGRLKASYLVSVGLEGALPFAVVLESAATSEDRTKWISLLGYFVRQAHDRGFAHDDLEADHVMVVIGRETHADRSTGALYFIDLDGGRLYDEPVPAYRRAHNFHQIFRSLPPHLFGPQERRIFYQAYSHNQWTPEHMQAFDNAIRWIQRLKKISKLGKLKTWTRKA